MPKLTKQRVIDVLVPSIELEMKELGRYNKTPYSNDDLVKIAESSRRLSENATLLMWLQTLE